MGEHCTVCGESLVSRFPGARDPLTGERFSIYRCARCGLGHTIPRPVDAGKYYPSAYYGNRHGITSGHCLRRRLGFVNAAVPRASGRRLLDIGCGDGSFLLAAKGAGWDVMGTEWNPLQARASGLDVKEGLDQVPSSGPFDCVTMWHSLEHMPDIPSTLAGIARLMRPGGKLVIAVPDLGGLQAAVFRHRWIHLDVPRHRYHFDAASLRYCLASAGFSVERQWHQEFEYDLIGWSQSALNCIVPSANIYYDVLVGRRGGRGAFVVLANVVLGSVLSVLFLPAVAAGTLSGRGGTLVAIAGRGA